MDDVKTYKEFEAGMSEEQKSKAKELLEDVCGELMKQPPLMCYSDKPTDKDHIKPVEIPIMKYDEKTGMMKSYTLTPEQQAEVNAYIEKIKNDPGYQLIKDIVWCGPGFTDEEIKAFGWDEDLEEDEHESTNYTKEQAS